MSLKDRFVTAATEPIFPVEIDGFEDLHIKVLSSADVARHKELTSVKGEELEKGLTDVIWILVSICDSAGNLVFDPSNRSDQLLLMQNCSLTKLRKITRRILEVNGLVEDSVDEAKND